MSELLAPSGDLISLKAAIASGADAVYLGLSAFNARIKAQNFTSENIAETVKYCHLFGVKVYITVNISVKNDEITDVDKLITDCKNADVDAFIVTDVAVLDSVKRLAPEIPAHASTQIGVCNLEGALYAEKLGFTRVVLAREATLDEIRAIKAHTNLEIEYFVHGALCVAFSGKCLMSSVINGGSGNRGRCLQPCRLQYTEQETGNSGYLLSTSDLCMLDKLHDLVDAGVDSFKIEGRLRRPEYVYNTVKTYRKALDNGYKTCEKDFDDLKAAYNRGGFTRGYSYDDTRKIMSAKVQGNLGADAGTIIKIENGFCITNKKRSYVEGDGYKLFDEKGREVGGGKIDKINAKGYPYVKEAKIGYSFGITSTQFSFEEKKIPVDIDYALSSEGILSVIYKCGAISVNICSQRLAAAEKKPLDKSVLESSLSKFSDTVFSCGKVSGRVDGAFFAPFSILNDVRRKGMEILTEKLLSSYKRKQSNINYSESIIKNSPNESGLIAVEVQSAAQLSQYLLNNADIIVYYPDVYTERDVDEFLSSSKGCDVYIKLTPNAREKDVKLYENILQKGFAGIYADNLYALSLAEKFNKKVFLGQGMNVFNNKALSVFNHDYYLVSPELNLREISSFNSPFVFAYGKLPLMNFSHCVYQLSHKNTCEKCGYKKEIVYKDNKNYSFDIFRNKAVYCYFTLYNSKITDISGKFDLNGFNYYLNMLQCDCNKAAEIVEAFKKGIPLNTPDATNGHLKRGVQ